jgi:hypothetical protein
MELHLSLRAPEGQGWLGSPRWCTGVGTDNLQCVFKVAQTLQTHSLLLDELGLGA